MVHGHTNVQIQIEYNLMSGLNKAKTCTGLIFVN